LCVFSGVSLCLAFATLSSSRFVISIPYPTIQAPYPRQFPTSFHPPSLTLHSTFVFETLKHRRTLPLSFLFLLSFNAIHVRPACTQLVNLFPQLYPDSRLHTCSTYIHTSYHIPAIVPPGVFGRLRNACILFFLVRWDRAWREIIVFCSVCLTYVICSAVFCKGKKKSDHNNNPYT